MHGRKTTKRRTPENQKIKHEANSKQLKAHEQTETWLKSKQKRRKNPEKCRQNRQNKQEQ